MSAAATAVGLSLLSSLCLALMIVFDRVMVGDCYQDRPDQAWLVSSVAGSALGLVASAATWVLYTAATDNGLTDLVATLTSHWHPAGWLVVLSGAVSVQVTRHYFRLFVPGSDGVVNETAIAMWVASTPVFVYLSLAALPILGLDRGVLGGLARADVSWPFGLLVAGTVAALLRFEAASGTASAEGRVGHRFQIVLLVGSTILYTVLLSAVLGPDDASPELAVALLPLYWIGFAAGGRAALMPATRADFVRNWRRLRRFAGPIIVAEVIGMFVFFTEFFALGAADPTLVNLIISSHVIVVFLLTLQLSRLRASMEANGVRRIWVLGLRLTRRRLPEGSADVLRQAGWLCLALAGLASCVYLSS